MAVPDKINVTENMHVVHAERKAFNLLIIPISIREYIFTCDCVELEKKGNLRDKIT